MRLAAHTFRCAWCGGDTKFVPSLQSLRCSYCGAAQPVSLARVRLDDCTAPIAELYAMEASSPERVLALECPRCGATVTFAPDRRTASCVFCAERFVEAPRDTRVHASPRAIVPFRVDAAQAGALVTRWIARQRMRPAGFRASARLAECRAVYVPYRVFSLEVRSRASTSPVGPWQTRTCGHRAIWIAASRGLLPHLADRLISSGSDDRLQALAPEVMAGSCAEIATLPLADSASRARLLAEASDRAGWRDRLGARHDATVHVAGEITRETAFDALYPVYVAAYRYRGAIHQVLVDGHHGRVIGWAPYSTAKLVIGTIVVPALVLAILVGPAALVYAALATWMVRRELRNNERRARPREVTS